MHCAKLRFVLREVEVLSAGHISSFFVSEKEIKNTCQLSEWSMTKASLSFLCPFVSLQWVVFLALHQPGNSLSKHEWNYTR